MLWVYIWLGVVALTMVLEFITMELVSIWISLGALVAMILAACGVGYEIQIIVAIVVSIGCILGLRRVTLKLLNKNKDKTNMDLIIGVKTKLLTPITKDEMGSVKHNGITYSSITENGTEVAEGEYVVIQEIKGNKLIVKKGE